MPKVPEGVNVKIGGNLNVAGVYAKDNAKIGKKQK